MLMLIVVVVMDMMYYPIEENHNDVAEYHFHDMFVFVDEFHLLVYRLVQVVNEL